MKYTRRVSFVNVVGTIWMPATTAAMSYTLDLRDVKSIEEDGKVTRETVQNWVDCNTGDFQNVSDFSASIETSDGETVNIDWQSEDSEMIYNDITDPVEAE